MRQLTGFLKLARDFFAQCPEAAETYIHLCSLLDALRESVSWHEDGGTCHEVNALARFRDGLPQAISMIDSYHSLAMPRGMMSDEQRVAAMFRTGRMPQDEAAQADYWRSHKADMLKWLAAGHKWLWKEFGRQEALAAADPVKLSESGWEHSNGGVDEIMKRLLFSIGGIEVMVVARMDRNHQHRGEPFYKYDIGSKGRRSAYVSGYLPLSPADLKRHIKEHAHIGLQLGGRHERRR